MPCFDCIDTLIASPSFFSQYDWVCSTCPFLFELCYISYLPIGGLFSFLVSSVAVWSVIVFYVYCGVYHFFVALYVVFFRMVYSLAVCLP